MNEAALRYSPEMAEAFQKALTARPATKKSLAVCEIRVAQTPSPSVTSTITATKATGIQAALVMAGDHPLAGQSRHLVLDGLRGADEVGGQQPGDRIEQQPQEQPGGAETGDLPMGPLRRVLVDERQPQHQKQEDGG